MQKLEVLGGKKLKGRIQISGSKNATLPILAATILSKEKVHLSNIPKVKDIDTMINLLKYIGSKIIFSKKKKSLSIQNNDKLKPSAPYNMVKTMRAGILVLGPMLARFHKAKVSLPGGCSIGTRPVDVHLNSLSKLGVKYKISNGYIYAYAKRGLVGAKIKFVDCDNSFCIDTKKIKKAINKKTKAIIPVHFTGCVSNMDEIMKISKKFKIPIIEDACQSILGSYKNRISGTFGLT